jgi:hypothetical protein
MSTLHIRYYLFRVQTVALSAQMKNLDDHRASVMKLFITGINATGSIIKSNTVTLLAPQFGSSALYTSYTLTIYPIIAKYIIFLLSGKGC